MRRRLRRFKGEVGVLTEREVKVGRLFSWRRLFGWGALLLFGVAGLWLVQLIWFKPWSIEHFYDRVFVKIALKEPELLTRLRVLERWGVHFHNDDLSDGSDAALLGHLDTLRDELSVLKSYSRGGQSPSQLISTDILTWLFSHLLEVRPYIYHYYPINPLFGVQSELPVMMTTMHPLKTHRDARNYIVRLSKFGWKFGQLLEGLRERERRGLFLPKVIVRKTLVQLRGFVSTPADENLLSREFARKIRRLGWKEGEVRGYLREVNGEIEGTIYPVYRRLIVHFERILGKAPVEVGLWRRPGGAALYRLLLRLFTSTRSTPEEIHRFGLGEVKRIQGEMRVRLKGLGLGGESISEGLGLLRGRAGSLYTNDARGRRRCLEDFRKILGEVRLGLPLMFGVMPKVGLEVKRLPVFKEKTAPMAYYNPPAMDGSRAGTFFVNLRDMGEVPRFGMRTLAYHEGLPGHHLQLSVQFLRRGVPIFRRVGPFIAFIEGWGLYAERLAWEHGFQKDPRDDLGRLQAELFRAVRLVVDTGLHAMRWSRERAIETMVESTGIARAKVETEIDRYIVMPGQACAYTLGMHAFLRLRKKAKRVMGTRFKLRQFHGWVLEGGAMPFEILERVIDMRMKEALGK